MAKKNNTHADEIDFTPFMYTGSGPQDPELLGKPGCGGCHPGGGVMEHDRDGKRYDKRLKENPELAKSLDGDYYKSKWDKTGVVEVDCFFCHYSKFSFKKRNKQLKYQNFKWASVSASGIGLVKGKVKAGETPIVTYNRRLFDEDGRISLPMSRKSSNDNCLLCHGWIDMAKRGTSWGDKKNMDVHQLGGLNCVDCHSSGLDHNFGKGDIARSSVRNDLDHSMKTCEECHTTSYMGAPDMKHLSLRNDHLEKLSCAACHIPFVSRSAIGAMVMSTGPAYKYPQYQTKKIGENVVWKPGYELRKKAYDDKAKIHPVNPLISILFTNKDKNIYYPLFAPEVKKAYNKVANQLTNKDSNKFDFHTPEDITLMLATISKTLIGNKRFTSINPYFHSGGTVFSLDQSGKLLTDKDTSWVARIPPFSISHNVAPPHMALGANGCTDCHSSDAHLFSGTVITDIFGAKGLPVTMKTGELIGFDLTTFKLNYFFQYYLTSILPVLILGLVLLIVFLVLRYIGKKTSNSEQLISESSELAIFARSEFWAVIFRVAVFLFLISVAHLLVFADIGMISLFTSIYKKAVIYAGLGGIAFFLMAILLYVILIKTKSTKFVDKKRRILWLINTLAVIMAITGGMLLIKTNFSIKTNLFISSLHGVIAMVFLACIFVFTYVVISSTLKKRSVERK